MIRLRTLGALDLQGSEGQQVRVILAQPKRVALLAYLALAIPRGFHRRDTLTALFWPEHDAEHARNSLSQSVHVLRRSLGATTIVGRNGDALGLEWRDFCCDAVAFEDALDAGRTVEAIDHYQGDLLQGFHLSDAPEFERWLEAERRRLAGRHAKAVTALAAQCAAERDFDGAVTWWRRLVASDPYSSRNALGLMRALAAGGDPAAAVQHARAHELLLRTELDIDADPEIEALVVQLKNRRSSGSPTALGGAAWTAAPAALRDDERVAPPAAPAATALAALADVLRETSAPDEQRAPERAVPASFDLRGRRRGLMRLTAAGAIAVISVLALRDGPTSVERAAAHERYLDDLYRRGRQAELDRSLLGVQSAMGYYRRAIEYDSSFALGYAGLSGTYGFLADYDYAPPRPALDSARMFARKAMEIDSTLSASHAALAVTLGGDRSFEAAERHFRRAVEIDPRDAHARYWYAILLVALGRGQDALDELSLVTQADPFAPRGVTAMKRYSIWLVTGQRPHLAIPVDKRPYPILDIEPGEAYALGNDAIDRAHQGDCVAARHAVEHAETLVPRGNIRFLGFVGEVYRLCGDRAGMLEVLRRMKSRPTSNEHGHWIAMLHAMANEPDSAFFWLERTRWTLAEMSALSADRRFDPIRSDQRFPRLLQRLGLRSP